VYPQWQEGPQIRFLDHAFAFLRLFERYRTFENSAEEFT
jgi:hypothetical protein